MTDTPTQVIAPELLAMLRCPRSGASIRMATATELEQINHRIAQGTCTDAAEEPVTEPLTAALIGNDNQWYYPIRDGIPSLIPDEAIPATVE